jgi:hypothetical protein
VSVSVCWVIVETRLDVELLRLDRSCTASGLATALIDQHVRGGQDNVLRQSIGDEQVLNLEPFARTLQHMGRRTNTAQWR